MSPKEKAEELVTKMYVNQWRNNTMEYKTAKQYALIAVNEIIKAMRKGIPEIDYGTGYWSDVRKQIEKL